MCGIVGLHLVNSDDICTGNPSLIDCLYTAVSAIQHRGYDGAGIAYEVANDGRMNQKYQKDLSGDSSVDSSREPPVQTRCKVIKGAGMIRQVFNDFSNHFTGSDGAHQGLAHTRYRTVGECRADAAQPLLTRDQRICLVHNGQVDAPGYLPDSEYILDLFEALLSALESGRGRGGGSRDSTCAGGSLNPLEPDVLFEVVRDLFGQLRGSYSCLVLLAGHGMLAFRDPKGIRPLILGRTERGEVLIASESVCHKALFPSQCWTQIRDIDPGEAIFIDRESGEVRSSHILPQQTIQQRLRPCLFEYIYLAHPGSMIEGLQVSEARQAMGALLARRIRANHPEMLVNLALVVPIPETSCVAAHALARELGVRYQHLISLNPDRAQARSFILPTQEERIRAVAEKFILPRRDHERDRERDHERDQHQQDNDQDLDLGGRDILLVDDSIVRGTTLGHLVNSIREAISNLGRVYVASVAPPVRQKNQYGIDIPTSELLIARGRSEEEIARIIGADGVVYQDLQEIVTNLSAMMPNRVRQFEISMFLDQDDQDYVQDI